MISKKNSEKLVNRIFAMFAILTVFLGLIPLIRLALYTAPYYDDFSYGMNVKWYLDGTYPREILKHGFFSIVFRTIHEFRYSWQGTYGSILFMSLMPASFGDQYYFIGPVIIILSLAVSTYFFTFLFCKYVVKGKRNTSIIVSSAMTLFLVELVYSAHQGFYWYNGAVHYTFMHSMMFFMLSLMLGLLYTQKIYFKITLSILFYIMAFIVAGANFTTALQGACLLLLAFSIEVIIKNKNCWYLLPGLLIYGWGLYFNCGAPGNNVRAQFFEGQRPVESIINSIIEAFYEIPTFTGLVSVGFMIILAPFLVDLVRDCNYNFKYPVLVTALSFLMYATGFTPSFYAMGNAGLDRTWNVIKFTYQILLIINEGYWIGWLCHRKSLDEKLNLKLILMPIGCALIFMSFVISGNQAWSFSSYGAFYYVHIGEAACYKQECDIRLEKIDEANGGDVVVSPYVFSPWLLCGTNELSYDRNAEQNRFMAQFYHVNSIRLDDGMGNASN